MQKEMGQQRHALGKAISELLSQVLQHDKFHCLLVHQWVFFGEYHKDFAFSARLRMSQSCDVEWLLIDPVSGKSTSLAPGAFEGLRDFAVAQQRSSSLPQRC